MGRAKRALGIDPGTGSFDLVVVEGPRVVWEKSIPTRRIAAEPHSLVEAVHEAGRVDLIAGPSGYGVPVTCNGDIIDPAAFALRILLLTRPEDLEEGLRAGDPGIYVYKALMDAVVEFWREKLPVCYIPGVIHLPTVPRYRKINKLDMGTADKLAVTVLGVYDESWTHNVSIEETRFILVEMGYGYNAVIGVRDGLIIDGYGGTLTPIGGLTIGPLDMELAVLGKTWRRYDVFHGGLMDICRARSIEEVIEEKNSDPECRDGYRAMIESIVKTTRMIEYSVGRPMDIVLSGRLTRYPEILEDVTKELESIAPVRKLNPLPGARISKEAGQGYAIVGEGLAGGFFKELIDHMKIKKTRGTVLDHTYHAKFIGVRDELRSILGKSVKNRKY